MKNKHELLILAVGIVIILITSPILFHFVGTSRGLVW